MQVVSSAAMSGLVSRMLDFLARVLALALAGAGWKKRTVHANVRLMGLAVDHFFHLRLCHHAARDLLNLLLIRTPPNYRMSTRDRKQMATLSSQGGILLSAHFHNWEGMGSWLIKQNMPLLALSKELASPFWNRCLRLIRERRGLPTISKSPIRPMKRWLNKRGVFAILLDQHVEDGVAGIFFGRAVKISPLLQAARGYPVFFFLQLPPDQIRVFCLSRKNSNPEQCVRRYHRILEIVIQRHPDYWYGFLHRRFKFPDPGVYLHVSRETCAPSP